MDEGSGDAGVLRNEGDGRAGAEIKVASCGEQAIRPDWRSGRRPAQRGDVWAGLAAGRGPR
jgi:hypothetical protein